MSEVIKPDLVLPMKRCWFARVWNGEKTVEYREVKPYWAKRIGDWVGEHCHKFVEMRLGYAKSPHTMLLQVDRVDIGPCPYNGWDGDYYRMHFHVIERHMNPNGTHLSHWMLIR